MTYGAVAAGQTIDPRRYHEAADPNRSPIAPAPPVCLYLEVTNRCNLLCTTCPRTYADLEPPADMDLDRFRSIVDQLPNLKRAVLHGVGEPMLVKHLPTMVRYLAERNIYVLFNTNGTVMTERSGRALIEAGLDELRVSLDAATRETFKAVRGKDYFDRILANVRRFRAIQDRAGAAKPRVSLWLTGLKETVAELPAFVRIAAASGSGIASPHRITYRERRASTVDSTRLLRVNRNQVSKSALRLDLLVTIAMRSPGRLRLSATINSGNRPSENVFWPTSISRFAFIGIGRTHGESDGRRQFSRVNPSALQSSLPTP